MDCKLVPMDRSHLAGVAALKAVLRRPLDRGHAGRGAL